GRLQELLQVLAGSLGGMLQNSGGKVHRLITDEIQHEADLAGRDAGIVQCRFRFHVALFSFLYLVVFAPAWPLKVRVGANSPSLWPTMSSVMYTGTCLRPSCTAMVWPTKSGKIIEALLQVFTIFFSP